MMRVITTAFMKAAMQTAIGTNARIVSKGLITKSTHLLRGPIILHPTVTAIARYVDMTLQG